MSNAVPSPAASLRPHSPLLHGATQIRFSRRGAFDRSDRLGAFTIIPTIPISDAKAKLAALVRAVAATGERYVISVNGHHVAELRAFVPVPTPG